MLAGSEVGRLGPREAGDRLLRARHRSTPTQQGRGRASGCSPGAEVDDESLAELRATPALWAQRLKASPLPGPNSRSRLLWPDAEATSETNIDQEAGEKAAAWRGRLRHLPLPDVGPEPGCLGQTAYQEWLPNTAISNRKGTTSSPTASEFEVDYQANDRSVQCLLVCDSIRGSWEADVAGGSGREGTGAVRSRPDRRTGLALLHSEPKSAAAG